MNEMNKIVCLLLILLDVSYGLVILKPEERLYIHARGMFANFLNITHNVNATIVLADPIYACEPLTFDATGKFVLVKRNDDDSFSACSFATKVKNVENSGALLAIIMNSRPTMFNPDTVVSMSFGEEEIELANSINITAIFITYQAGMEIMAYINQGETIASFGIEGDVEYENVDILALTVLVTSMSLFMVLIFGCIYLIERGLNNKKVNTRKRAVHHIKSKTYKSVEDAEQYETLCSICQEIFQENDRVKILPCGHLFHTTCVEKWLIDEKPICPNCRHPVIDESNEPQFLRRTLTPQEQTRAERRTFIIDVVFYIFLIVMYIIILS